MRRRLGDYALRTLWQLGCHRKNNPTDIFRNQFRPVGEPPLPQLSAVGVKQQLLNLGTKNRRGNRSLFSTKTVGIILLHQRMFDCCWSGIPNWSSTYLVIARRNCGTEEDHCASQETSHPFLRHP